MQYCLPFCAAAAHILKCRSVCIYHGASGMPPPLRGSEEASRPNGGPMWASAPTAVGRSTSVERGGPCVARHIRRIDSCIWSGQRQRRGRRDDPLFCLSAPICQGINAVFSLKSGQQLVFPLLTIFTDFVLQ